MNWKHLGIFVAMALLAGWAGHARFGDSSHALGLLNVKGGKARHPFQLTAGKSRYTLIATATVLPPVAGDIRVELRGAPLMGYAIYDSAPIVPLPFRPRPVLADNILRDTRPRDRLTLWVVMRPATQTERDWPAPPTPLAQRSQHPDEALALVFSDSDSNRTLLRIPVVFAATQGDPHAD